MCAMLNAEYLNIHKHMTHIIDIVGKGWDDEVQNYLQNFTIKVF
jgi:hypothetical protein